MISHQVLFDLGMKMRILDCIFPTPNKPIPQALGNNGRTWTWITMSLDRMMGGSSKYMLIIVIL